MTMCSPLPVCNVTFKMFHDLAPARSSNILSPKYSSSFGNISVLPPNIKTPLPSGDLAIGLNARGKGNRGPVNQKKSD